MADGRTRITLTGEAFRWDLWLSHFEFPGDPTVDGQWIVAEVQLSATPYGVFQARLPLSVMAEDLVGFSDALSTLLSAKTGSAEFQTLEDDTALAIIVDEQSPDGWRVEARVGQSPSPLPVLSSAELMTSEREVRSLLHTVREAARVFPSNAPFVE